LASIKGLELMIFFKNKGLRHKF